MRRGNICGVSVAYRIPELEKALTVRKDLGVNNDLQERFEQGRCCDNWQRHTLLQTSPSLCLVVVISVPFLFVLDAACS